MSQLCDNFLIIAQGRVTFKNAGPAFECDEDIPSPSFSEVRHPSSLSINPKDMSIPEVKVEKEIKMEEQLNEITELCKKFSASIGIIEKSQYELCTQFQAQSTKEEKLENEIASALNNCNTKIEELHQKVNTQRSASGIKTSSFTGANPATQHEQKNSPKFSEALKTVSSPSFQYHGNPRDWPVHKKKLLNLIWALSLPKIEAIKTIKMSFAGPAVFIAENINAEELINQMNGDDNGHEGYLTALENLFVGKAESELSRTKFSSAIQERNESIPLFASKLNSLFNTAFPNESEPNTNILVIDKFVNGLRDEEQKKFVLQQKEKDDSLEKLIDLALKYEAVNSIMKPRQPSFNFGNNNNISAVNRNRGRMFNAKPRYTFNPRRFMPYPRFSRPTSSNYRPFGFRNNSNNNFRSNSNGFQNYQPKQFGTRPGYQHYPRNNQFTSYSSGSNQSSANYTNRNNSSNSHYNNTNKSSKNNFAKRGNTFNNKKYATRKNQGRASIHQIDNMHEESQD